MTEENTYDDIDIKRKREKKLITRLVIGEIIIFLLFSVMLYFYNKSKDKNILINAIVLFIHLQTILLGVLYTYYYEIKNNINDRYRYHFNKRGGNVALFFICFLLISTCLLMFAEMLTEINILKIILMLGTYVILYFYITSYKKFVINPLYG